MKSFKCLFNRQILHIESIFPCVETIDKTYMYVCMYVLSMVETGKPPSKEILFYKSGV